MNLKGFIYFMIPSIVWGSTWYAIKFQIGTTDPLFSVSYRFTIAGIILLLFGIIAGKSLKISLRGHLMILLQGLCLFGVNYWLVYLAEIHLTSALVAVVFSTLIFTNIFFNRLILKAPVQKEIVIASLIGFSGVVLLFKDEITFNFSDNNFIALLFCTLSVILASVGNILSVYNLKKNISLIQSNAFGMLYGGVAMALIAFAMNKPFSFDLETPYVVSLIYLAVFGSVVGFSFYLKMQSEIGPDKAGYVAMLIPVIALITSTIFENYTWTYSGFLGTILIVSGNALAILKKRKVPAPLSRLKRN